VTRDEILAAWAEFHPLAGQGLPTAPAQPVEWTPQNDRPQPRLDRNRGNGMAVTVGRLRPCNVLDWKFVVLSHNTIRGAAGAAILNAELLASLGKLEPVALAARGVSAQRIGLFLGTLRCRMAKNLGARSLGMQRKFAHESGSDEVWRHVGGGSGGYWAHRGHCGRARGAWARAPWWW
jgi:hypothetical protein